MQQEQHVQSTQAAMAKQHSGFLAPKLPFHLNDQQQQQPEQPMYLQQQQLNQPQVGLRSAAPGGTYHGVQAGIGNNFMNIQETENIAQNTVRAKASETLLTANAR
ncbi:uncharacterized protein LOC120202691 [Hibiscus syriacus]|nr:uncharacterized protein LOC120202691 [Hibiscus syriacus]